MSLITHDTETRTSVDPWTGTTRTWTTTPPALS